jgi:hypothetical protein
MSSVCCGKATSATMDRRWEGRTVAIVASGPSLKNADLDALANVPTIAVNDNWRKVPTAEILYAADAPWWAYHDYVPEFAGERWTQQKGPSGWARHAMAQGLRVIQSAASPGVSTDPALIHTGSNSAFQALNLAVLGGARRVLLLGCDMTGAHWFGRHPPELRRPSPYDRFRAAFERAAPQLQGLGVEVINCSPISTIQAYPRMPLPEALSCG